MNEHGGFKYAFKLKSKIAPRILKYFTNFAADL